MRLFLGYSSPHQMRPSQTNRPSELSRPPIQNTYYNPSDVGPSDSISQIAYRQQSIPQVPVPVPQPYQQSPPAQRPVAMQQQQPYQPRAQYVDPYMLIQNQGAMSPAPSSQLGFVRKRTVKQIPLTPQGNLVIDVPVAARVARMGKYSVGDEFTHMRCKKTLKDLQKLTCLDTAVTCPPDEFAKRGYSLRQQELQRSTEVFIVVTMYGFSTLSP